MSLNGHRKSSVGFSGVGLVNTANNCYLNSVIQILCHIDEIGSFFNHIDFTDLFEDKADDLTKKNVVIQFASICKSLNENREGLLDPKELKECIGAENSFFKTKEQCDAQEFLLCLLNIMREVFSVQLPDADETKNVEKMDSKQFVEYITGTRNTVFDFTFLCSVKNTFTCSNCSMKRNTYDISYCLSLPVIPKAKCISVLIYSKVPGKMSFVGNYENIIYEENDVNSILMNLKEKYSNELENSNQWIFCKTRFLKTRISRLTDPLSHVLYYNSYSVVGIENPEVKTCHLIENIVHFGESIYKSYEEVVHSNNQLEVGERDSFFKRLSRSLFPNNKDPVDNIIKNEKSVGIPLLIQFPKPIPNNVSFYDWIYNSCLSSLLTILELEKKENKTFIALPKVKGLYFEVIGISAQHNYCIIDEAITWKKSRIFKRYVICWNLAESPLTDRMQNYCAEKLVAMFSEDSCEMNNVFYDYVTSLNLVKPETHLSSCLSLYLDEIMQIEDALCSECNSKCLTKGVLSLSSSPKVLILHLKMFDFTQNCKKVHSPLDIPDNLSLNNYTKDNLKYNNYELFAMVCHGGTLTFGHYVALISSRRLKTEENKKIWRVCDDEYVDIIDENKLFLYKKMAYVLFYRTVDM